MEDAVGNVVQDAVAQVDHKNSAGKGKRGVPKRVDAYSKARSRARQLMAYSPTGPGRSASVQPPVCSGTMG